MTNFYANVYAELIRKDRKVLDDVPANLRAEVKAILEGKTDE